MSVWVLTAKSCSGCNCSAVRGLDHAPSRIERVVVSNAIGGMWCIEVGVDNVYGNGEVCVLGLD